ncbi:MAG: DNA polymerase III subunit delta' [Bacteroidetes bacterium]|nr:MAG: DNA polymerase III subunit delta' [Bacteroidota bacterium]
MQFQELIGQQAVARRVLEAIQQNRLPHALMLTGPEGVGKLAFANAIAQYVNCLKPGPADSCGSCSQCRKIRKGLHPDLKFILPIISKKEGGRQLLSADYYQEFRQAFFQHPYMSSGQWQRMLGGENKQLMIGVHEIREMKQQIFLKAFEGRYKVLLVWQAELINRQGANAFLKLLEEPPDQTLIIMTCSDPSRLLSTINSRCQQIRLGRVGAEEIQAYLQKQHQLSQEQAAQVATIAEGSIANALEFIEESNIALKTLYVEWLRAIYTGNYPKMSAQTEKICKENKEYQKLFLVLAIKKMRDSLLYHLGVEQLALLTEEEKAFQQNFSKLVDATKVERITRALEESRRQIMGNANAQMVFSALSIQIYSILRAA